LSANLTTTHGYDLTFELRSLTYEDCQNMLGIATCGRASMMIEFPPNPEGNTKSGVSGSLFVPDHLFQIEFRFDYVLSSSPTILHVSSTVSKTGQVDDIIEVNISS
jgi:hypothetical protein